MIRSSNCPEPPVTPAVWPGSFLCALAPKVVDLTDAIPWVRAYAGSITQQERSMDEEVEIPLDALETAQSDDAEDALGDGGASSTRYTYTGAPSSG
jgi:hypothetical protein